MSEVKLYSVKEVARIMKTNTNFVYSLIKSGLLPALKLGSLKVREESLRKFLEEYENHE